VLDPLGLSLAILSARALRKFDGRCFAASLSASSHAAFSAAQREQVFASLLRGRSSSVSHTHSYMQVQGSIPQFSWCFQGTSPHLGCPFGHVSEVCGLDISTRRNTSLSRSSRARSSLSILSYRSEANLDRCFCAWTALTKRSIAACHSVHSPRPATINAPWSRLKISWYKLASSWQVGESCSSWDQAIAS
jgi:hypothetical protein